MADIEVNSNRYQAHLQKVEAEKLFLEKWDQLNTHALYVSVGVFAVLPTVLNALRSPYGFYSLIWVVVGVGIIASASAAFVKLHVNGYYRRLSRMIARDIEDINLDILPMSWIMVQIAFLAVFIQVAAFVAFIAVNIPRSFQEPPRIENLQASQLIVEPGDSISIQANAIDRDRDTLSYTWQTSAGTIIDDNEPNITWVAPKSIASDEERISVSVVVFDGRTHSERDTSVIVRESPEIKAGIHRLCLMAKPIEASIDNASNVALREGHNTRRSSSSPVKIDFQSETRDTPQLKPGHACTTIREFVQEGETKQERQTRIELAKSEIESQIEMQTRSSTRKEKRCCSEVLLPFFCNPTC
jgi:hypothetical protein